MVYRQELDFLEFSKALLQSRFRVLKKQRKGGTKFKGLSREGQTYFKTLLSKRALLFLLEKGANVQGAAIVNQIRTSQYDFFTRPEPFVFGKDLYPVILSLFDSQKSLPESPDFTPADQIILTLVLERHYDHRLDSIRPEAVEFILCNSFLCLGFFLDRALELSIDPKSLISSYYRHENSRHYFYCLRHLIRDHLLRQFEQMMDRREPQQVETYGIKLQGLLSFLFDHFLKNNQMESFEPFCQVIHYFFKHKTAELVEEKWIKQQHLDYEADKIKARKRLMPLFEWTKLIDGIQKRAVCTRAYDDNFESMNIFKRAYSAIPEESKINSIQIRDHLENLV